MAEGRGAWTMRGKGNASTYYAREGTDNPRDGQLPTNHVPDLSWFEAVRYGVGAIQQCLILAGEHNVPDTMEYGKKTRAVVKAFQDERNLAGDGKVGMMTMTALLRPVMLDAATKANMHPKWLYGLARQESALDPGAQGGLTPGDRGIWQHNTETGPLTPGEAHNVLHAAKVTGLRWKGAAERFGGKGDRLRIDCSIMQHRSPVAAQYLYDNETPYGPESQEYVLNVRAFAQQWK